MLNTNYLKKIAPQNYADNNQNIQCLLDPKLLSDHLEKGQPCNSAEGPESEPLKYQELPADNTASGAWQNS
ncbi:hypothetical protein TcasGA2_TC030956 [Tribolium castaneum]|uniref:Uncharacterized protein n=1 Tax=Tribolium castaneum TaxID=7070 RepID=A0A139W9H1_TRICA|nr:hypothetical protein TcasGA2_TC030956 [Tribolium castaneum]